jgi:hypothetical protein
MFKVRILHEIYILAAGICLLIVTSGASAAQDAAASNLPAQQLPCSWTSPAGEALPCDGYVYPNPTAVNPPYNEPFEGDGLAANAPPAPHDNTLSTVSYPNNGNPPDPVTKLILPNGSCQYIVNSSNNTYFVPLRTEQEWTSFVAAANANPSLGISLLSCSDPNLGNPNLVDGSCGAAESQVSATEPAAATLCNAGTPSPVTSTTGCAWTWSCIGSNGQTTAVCQAPKVTVTQTTAITGPLNIGIILDASSSMDGMDAAAQQAVIQSMPLFAAAHPNISVTLTTFVLGGTGYNALQTGICHYGETYTGSLVGGISSDYGWASVQAGQYTPLADAVNYAGQMLNTMKGPNTTTALLVLTDGAETCGGDFQAAVQAQEANGTKMLAIAYQDSSYNPANFTAFNSVETATSAADMLNALNNVFNSISTNACPAVTASNP